MSKLDLRVRFNNKLHSIILNDYRIGGCKWNDIKYGECIEYPVNKEDVFVALGIDKTIADLQSQLDQANERLKGAIEPKFKIGQEVWAVSALRLNNIDSFIITEICYCADYGLYYKTNLGINLYEYYFDIFATLEEAEKKLQELRNGVFSGE